MIENGAKSYIIVMIELFKDAVQTYPLSDNLLYYQTPSCNCTPKELPLLSIKAIHNLSKDPQFIILYLSQGEL